MKNQSRKQKQRQKQRRNDLLPLLLIGAGVLLVIAVLVWQATRSNQTATPAANPNDPTSGVERVSLEDAKAALDSGEAIFLDVRDSQSYEVGHIPGAVNIPLALLQNRANELDSNKWIITYCT